MGLQVNFKDNTIAVPDSCTFWHIFDGIFSSSLVIDDNSSIDRFWEQTEGVFDFELIRVEKELYDRGIPPAELKKWSISLPPHGVFQWFKQDHENLKSAFEYLLLLVESKSYEEKVLLDNFMGTDMISNRYKEVILEYQTLEEMNEEDKDKDAHREQRELLKTINQMRISHNMKYIPRNK